MRDCAKDHFYLDLSAYGHSVPLVRGIGRVRGLADW